MMVPAGGPQPYPPYAMMMMPVMFPMQNMQHPFGGMMQPPLPAMNMTSTSGALVAHPSDVIMEGGKCKPFSCLLISCFRFSDQVNMIPR